MPVVASILLDFEPSVPTALSVQKWDSWY